jgi:UDP-N-acetylmuramoyl-tripeptide--D-alanyl-D-alanine ligase
VNALLWSALAMGGAAVLAWMRTRHALHMLQMDSYLNSRYLKWLFAKPFERLFEWRALFAKPEPPKKPLDMTGRAKRILWTSRAVIGFAAVGAAFTLRTPWAIVLAAVVVAHSAPWAAIASNVLLRPVQTCINRGFVRRAARKIAELEPLVIGVAGSYGKTSTKYFIETLLKERHAALKTPGSFNTLLGVTRVINEKLTAGHKVFIAEMGAYKRGEVKEICDLVHPKIGIITSIGPEHFERFLSMENIEETNYELIAALPADGLAVFNCENEHCRKLADRTRHTRVARYSFDKADGRNDVWAEDVTVTRDGLQFIVVTATGERVPVETVLVGRLNVLNILGAVCIAREMGLTREEIARGVSKLRPAPHRLEVKPGGGGTTIIDDSYNSNPFGAAEALNVLAQFTGGKRILVTPGMIELGELHQQANEEFGRQAAAASDFVILVGPEQTRPVAQGLRGAGFPEEKLRVVASLNEATEIFGKILRPGDVLLFENDLPDLYTEK